MIKNESLLSKEGISLCKSISSSKSLEGKRAKALLALNDGKTLKEAGVVSELTYGQVKYLLQRFRLNGLSVFPDSLTIREDTIKDEKNQKRKKLKKENKKKGKKMGKKKDKKKNKKKDKKEKKGKKKKGKKGKKK